MNTATATPIGTTQAKELFAAGRYREAVATWDAQLDSLVLHPPMDNVEASRERAKVEVSRSIALRRLGALEAAHFGAQRAIEYSKGFPDLRSRAHLVLAATQSAMGLSENAAGHARDAVRHAESSGDSQLVAMAKAEAATLVGRSDGPEKAYELFQDVDVDALDERSSAILHGNRAHVLRQMGKSQHARDNITEGVKLAKNAGDRVVEASLLLGLASIELDSGGKNRAMELTREALSIGRSLEHHLTQFRAEWLAYQIDNDASRGPALRRLYAKVRTIRSVEDVQRFAESDLAREREP